MAAPEGRLATGWGARHVDWDGRLEVTGNLARHWIRTFVFGSFRRGSAFSGRVAATGEGARRIGRARAIRVGFWSCQNWKRRPGLGRATADERIGSFTLTVASYVVLIKKKVKTDGPTRNLFCFSCFHCLLGTLKSRSSWLGEVPVTIYTA
jgi:hypothetical protein